MIIRIRGVKRVRAKGHTYYYHRRTMTRLPGEPGTTAFMDRLAELETKPPEPTAPLPGTLGHYSSATAARRNSSNWLNALAPITTK
jgi:hypothetical protein